MGVKKSVIRSASSRMPCGDRGLGAYERHFIVRRRQSRNSCSWPIQFAKLVKMSD